VLVDGDLAGDSLPLAGHPEADLLEHAAFELFLSGLGNDPPVGVVPATVVHKFDFDSHL
jgi:hypothetical protein